MELFKALRLSPESADIAALVAVIVLLLIISVGFIAAGRIIQARKDRKDSND